MADISIKFPDGAVKAFPAGTTPADVAKSISISLAKKAVAAKLDGQLVDYLTPLASDGSIEIVTKDSDDGLTVLRNTTAALLRIALKKEFPAIRLGKVSADEDGFFVDTDKDDQQVSVDELDALAVIVEKLVSDKLDIERITVSKADALADAKDDQFTTALINAVDGDSVPFLKIGDYQILSDGAQLTNTGDVKKFKLLSVAGAYWQGKSSNPMLQRIYGTAFYKQADLDADLARRQEARERDHRVIGNQLDLFFIDPKVGAGLPYWMPNGATIRRTIERYIIDKEVSNGYQHVYTPVLANLDLYKQSGHWAHYREDMFPPMDMGDGEMLELRPMNCPSHIQVYNHHIRSYRELPLRIAELGMMHRYEKSGALSGLQRVREMTLNDGHTFVAPEQIQDEFKSILDLMVKVYADFDIKDYTFRLSYRDPKEHGKVL